MSQYYSQAAEQNKAIAIPTPDPITAQSATPGYVRSIAVTNVNASARYLYVFDNTAASGTKLCLPVKVDPGATISLSFEPTMLKFSTGLYLSASSTQSTYTSSAGADFLYAIDTCTKDLVGMKPVRQVS